MLSPRSLRWLLPSTKGPLTILGIILFTSALIRVEFFDTPAFAQSNIEQAALTKEKDPTPTQLQCPEDEDLQRVLDALLSRESNVEVEENRIKQKMESLSAIEDEANRRLEEAKNAEEALRKTMALANKSAETDVAQLTSVYEKMKPKTAAAVFEEMNPNFASGFLGRMNSESAAEIMALLKPQTAYAISVVMAGRNTNAGIATKNNMKFPDP